MNATHPLARLSAAEAALIASIDAAAKKLDAVGTTGLDAAIGRLRDAAHAAAARLGSAGDAVSYVVGDLLDGILGQSLRIEDAMSHAEPTVEPAAGYIYTEPAQVVTEAPTAANDAVVQNDVTHGKGVIPNDTIEKYPSETAAFSPDGPTLFDDAGNPEPDEDPTAVLVQDKAVSYVFGRRGGRFPGRVAPEEAQGPLGGQGAFGGDAGAEASAVASFCFRLASLASLASAKTLAAAARFSGVGPGGAFHDGFGRGFGGPSLKFSHSPLKKLVGPNRCSAFMSFALAE